MLEPIGFCLIASEYFWWEGEADEGGRVANAAIDWSSPAINYPLTRQTVEKFRLRLTTGRNPFTRADVRPPV